MHSLNPAMRLKQRQSNRYFYEAAGTSTVTAIKHQRSSSSLKMKTANSQLGRNICYRPQLKFLDSIIGFSWRTYSGADKSLARPGRQQANVSVRMAWISFGVLPCRKKTWWQLASRCCWNSARPWHASELVSFLVGLRNYQHPGRTNMQHSFVTTSFWSIIIKFLHATTCVFHS